MKLLTGRVIDRLRERFPQYKWVFNRRCWHWECKDGYVCWVADMFCDEDTSSGRLCFYKYNGTPEWV
jgi:hypothetical protein